MRWCAARRRCTGPSARQPPARRGGPPPSRRGAPGRAARSGPTPDASSRPLPAGGLRPVDAAAQPLLRPEATLVFQRSAALDAVAEVHVGEPAMVRIFDRAQDVVRAEREMRPVRVVVAIDGGKRARRLVGDADADQLFLVPVRELATGRVREAELHLLGLRADPIGPPAPPPLAASIA